MRFIKKFNSFGKKVSKGAVSFNKNFIKPVVKSSPMISNVLKNVEKANIPFLSEGAGIGRDLFETGISGVKAISSGNYKPLLKQGLSLVEDQIPLSKNLISGVKAIATGNNKKLINSAAGLVKDNSPRYGAML